MAASWVQELAAGNPATSGTANNVITLAAAPAAGNTVVVAVATRDTATTGASLTDSRGNTWTVDAVQNAGNNLVMIASTRQDVATLHAADTITVHFTTAPNLNFAYWVEEVAGLVTSSAVDKTATNSNTGTTTSATSGTTAATAQADEFAVAAFCLNDSPAFSAFTKDAAYSWFTTHDQGTSGSKGGAAMFKVLSATGTQVASVSWTTGNSYTGVIVTYKAAGGSAQALAGTDAGTSTDTGDVVVAHPLAATDAGTSTDTGDLAVAHPLAGTESGTSTDTGAVTVAHTLAGTEGGTSADTGAVTVAHTLAATDAGTSTDTGALRATFVLAGTDAGTSTDTGDLKSLHPLAATDAGTSTDTGALSLATALAATDAGTSTDTGDLTGTWRLTASSSGTSYDIGALTVDVPERPPPNPSGWAPGEMSLMDLLSIDDRLYTE